jgi:hypothetical protein
VSKFHFGLKDLGDSLDSHPCGPRSSSTSRAAASTCDLRAEFECSEILFIVKHFQP